MNLGRFRQLKALVGIKDIYAKRIVEGRPYHRMDGLVTKLVILQTTYDKIKDRVLLRPKDCHLR